MPGRLVPSPTVAGASAALCYDNWKLTNGESVLAGALEFRGVDAASKIQKVEVSFFPRDQIIRAADLRTSAEPLPISSMPVLADAVPTMRLRPLTPAATEASGAAQEYMPAATGGSFVMDGLGVIESLPEGQSLPRSPPRPTPELDRPASTSTLLTSSDPGELPIA